MLTSGGSGQEVNNAHPTGMLSCYHKTTDLFFCLMYLLSEYSRSITVLSLRRMERLLFIFQCC